MIDRQPEETNAPYGLAKKMLLVQLQAYRQEFGFRPAPRLVATALHSHAAATGGMLCISFDSPGGFTRGARILPGEIDGDPPLRSG